MATADDVLAHIDVVFGGIDEDHTRIDAASTNLEKTVSQLDQVRSTEEELAEQSLDMGYEDKVSIIQAAVEKTNEAQAQIDTARKSLLDVQNELNAAATTLSEAQSQILSLKGLTAARRSAPRSRSRRAERGVAASAVPPPVPRGGTRRRLSFRAGIDADYPRSTSLPIGRPALRHILFGEPKWRDPHGELGGHVHGLGRPKKTEFPRHWRHDFIERTILSVADDPDMVKPENHGVWRARKQVEGVDVVAMIDEGGEVVAAWPLPGLLVRPNPGRPRTKNRRGRGRR